MSRYTGSKAKVNRALGLAVYEKAGAVKALERRPTAPGMHGKRTGKKSTFGLAMLEKKKVKHYYGLHERQLRRFLALAAKSPENTGEALLVLCERRLDNAVRRAGFARTRQQARQGVNHGHFRVNGKPVNVCSYLVRPGDRVQVAPRLPVQKLYRDLLTRPTGVVANWLFVESETLSFQVKHLPTVGEVGLEVDVNRVIELLTR
jgi:small subunit ribosomal protein S4